MNATQHRSSVFDFSLHFTLEAMCNNPDSFDSSSLAHAGLTGADSLGRVTFVEYHDTDQGSLILYSKMLAYAYSLTSEVSPCVFYRDHSTDKNCFGLKFEIEPLI